MFCSKKAKYNLNQTVQEAYYINSVLCYRQSTSCCGIDSRRSIIAAVSVVRRRWVWRGRGEGSQPTTDFLHPPPSPTPPTLHSPQHSPGSLAFNAAVIQKCSLTNTMKTRIDETKCCWIAPLLHLIGANYTPILFPSHLEPALLLPELLQGGSSFSRASPKAQEVSVVALCRQRLPEQQGQNVISLNRI